MGEATYQIRARFATPDQAAVVEEEMRALFVQMDAAYDFWQKNRGVIFLGKGKPPKRMTQDGFWKAFKKKFPLVYAFLPKKLRGGDYNNALAGNMSYTDQSEPDALILDGTLITYTATVWHFADWSPLVAWLRSKGANADYVSDEDTDPFAVLDGV